MGTLDDHQLLLEDILQQVTLCPSVIKMFSVFTICLFCSSIIQVPTTGIKGNLGSGVSRRGLSHLIKNPFDIKLCSTFC